jgi:uncharacterized protein (DUF362 family)
MKSRVILRNCESYDPNQIGNIIEEGMAELGVRPRGRTLVKPNTVIAHRRYYPHAFTRAEFLEGLFIALKQRGEEVTELTLGERCGITIPTRYVFGEAGYYPVLRRQKVHPCYFDEEPDVQVALESPPALRSFIHVPRPIVECDFFVNAPKFKAHPWTKVTFSIKNYVGLQDDKHRLIDHDHMLEYKVADLQQIISPDFIAIDAITAGQKTMLTPIPFPLNLIVMGVNPVAIDVICTHILRLDPFEVTHIRLAGERGFGPLQLDEIEILGDVALEEAQARAEGFELTLDRVDKIFDGPQSRITTCVGPPPDPDEHGYCWGGCPGALFEAMQLIQAVQPGVYTEVRPLQMAFGDVRDRTIDTPSEERLLFMGDCAMFDGEIAGRPVRIPFQYTPREEHNPCYARSSDLVIKIIRFIWLLFTHRGKQVMRVPGCPVSVAENVLALTALGKTKNPYLDPRIFVRFAYSYVIFQIAKFFRVTVPGFFRQGKDRIPGAMCEGQASEVRKTFSD